MENKARLNKKAMINIDLKVNDEDLNKYLEAIDEIEAHLAAARNGIAELSSLEIGLESKKR